MSFLQILIQEFKSFFAFKSIPLVVFGGSILYLLLYPTPYMNDVVKQQSIAIIDADHTTLSKNIIFLASASPYLKVKYVSGDNHQAHELLQQEEIMGVLMIPAGFEANLYRGVPTALQLEANASYFLIYGNIIDHLNQIIQSFNDEWRLNKIHHQGNKTQTSSSDLIVLDAIALYNQTSGYINYALAAILVFILHQTSILSSMMLGAFQNMQNNQGIKGYWNECSIIHLIAARLLVFGTFYTLLFLLFFGKGFEVYGVNIHASWIDFWCFAIIFILTCIALGIAIGFIVSIPTIPTQIILCSSIPLIFMMGFVWPFYLLPQALQFLASITPAYHGISGFIKLNQMGASLHAIMPHFYALVLLFIAFSAIAYTIASFKRSKFLLKLLNN